MNIEESIKILDKFTTEHKLFNIKHSDGLEEAIETLLTVYLNGFYDGEKKVKDKIKAKIEEVKDGTYDAKIVLESLLEKENKNGK